MIVMGARGQGVLAGAVMGRVSRRVVRRSETPVLVVPPPGEQRDVAED
jgi:nucleotide-binding universal stress UspA family protein